MAKTIHIDGVNAIMHFNSNVEMYHMANNLSGTGSNECCYCGECIKWKSPQQPGSNLTGNCPNCGKEIDYKTLILSTELATYFDVRGGTDYGSQLVIGGVMHIVLPRNHPEFDHLLGNISSKSTQKTDSSNPISDINPEASILLGVFGAFGVSPFIMKHDKYYLISIDIPENDIETASSIKEEIKIQANRLMKEGYEHFEQCRFGKAEYCFHQVSAWYYEPRAYLALAKSLIKQGKFDDGEKWLKETIDIDHRNFEAYFQLGNMLDEQPARIREAEQYYIKALELDDQHIGANNNLGLLLRNQRRYQEAIIYARKCTSLSKDPSLYENLGLTLSDAYQYEHADPAIAKEAEKAFLAAIKINPQSPKIYSNLAYLYMLIERYSESEQIYKKAIAIDPSYAPAYSNMCTLLQKIRRNKEAQEYLEKAISLDPGLAYRIDGR